MWALIGLILPWFFILIRICYTDIRYRLIKNIDVAFVLLLVIATLLITSQSPNFLAALIIFAIGFILVAINIVGAGDIKLLSVLALTIPRGDVVSYLLLMSIIGVFLALIEFFLRRFNKKHVARGLPYGVAISGSYLFVLIGILAQVNY